MADIPTAGITPAQKLVIDGVTFVVALVCQGDPRAPMIWEALAEAVPLAEKSRLAEVNALIAAAAELLAARDKMTGSAREGAADWMQANLTANAALMDFAWARFAQSHAGLFPAQPLEVSDADQQSLAI